MIVYVVVMRCCLRLLIRELDKYYDIYRLYYFWISDNHCDLLRSSYALLELATEYVKLISLTRRN